MEGQPESSTLLEVKCDRTVSTGLVAGLVRALMPKPVAVVWIYFGTLAICFICFIVAVISSRRVRLKSEKLESTRFSLGNSFSFPHDQGIREERRAKQFQ